MAITLVVLSLLAAIGISTSANRSVYVWAAKNQISAGSKITFGDVEKTKVFLPGNSKHYLAETAKIIDSYAVRTVAPGELIPATALTTHKSLIFSDSVPIKVARNDYPVDLTKGTLVDVYALPIRETSGKSVAISIAHKAPIEELDTHAKDIGGEIGVILKLNGEDVLDFLSATINSRLVVVRSAI